MTKYIWNDGLHLQNLSMSILNKVFFRFVNDYLFSNSHNCFWLNESHQVNKFDSNIGSLINLRKDYQNNPLIWYINVNFLREKIISLREVLSKAPINILCVDKTKLDASFP